MMERSSNDHHLQQYLLEAAVEAVEDQAVLSEKTIWRVSQRCWESELAMMDCSILKEQEEQKIK
jgi:hypothetical protein